ncbi:type II toxin-antitoxin system VapC family toxin [candidate division KSB1 bacterium]|nr:type II toxin-antitoxin system VapC family toxin [candidate division KSB1 bacterium]
MIDDPNLSPKARTTFLDSDSTLYLSMASVWEMAIKSGLNKLNLPLPVDQYITSRTQTHGITLLDITIEHMAAVENLPHHHKDPFDRLLISQCLSDKLPIMTADRMFAAYPIQTVW